MPSKTRKQRPQSVVRREIVLAGGPRLQPDAYLTPQVALRHKVEERLQQPCIQRTIRRCSRDNDSRLARCCDRVVDMGGLRACQQRIGGQHGQVDQGRLVAALRQPFQKQFGQRL